MAITSVGYPNTIAPGADFALMAYTLGRQYAVPFAGHCEVTKPSTGTRRVQISTGYIAGKGIVDYNGSVVTLDLPNAAGATQWFCIVLNRWADAGGGNFRSEFGWVAGTSARAVPALTQNPGVYDQHPIALVRVDSDKTSVQDVVDLRAIAEEPGTYTVYDDLAIDLVNRPGATVYNAKTGRTYRWVYNENKQRTMQRVYDTQAGVRPYLCVRRVAAFGGTVTSGSVPFYAGREQDHIKIGAWSDHLEYSNGASGAASPVSQTAPAYIRTKTDGTYAYGAFVDMESISNHSVMAFSIDVDQDAIAGSAVGQVDPYHQNYVLAGERVMWSLTNTLWLPAGSRLHPSFGKGSGAIQLHRWWMWMTRLGD